MKSVTLIAPKSENESASNISALTSPLSGILILATILKNNNYEVKFYDESFKKPNYEKIDSEYILITSMSATVNRAYSLADYFKNKGKKVFLGGLHVSFDSKEAIKHCDKVVVGEGENIIFDLFEDKINNKIIKGKKVLDLNSIPMPDYSLVEGMQKNPDVVSVCTSRGCPYDCKFCSLKRMFGKKYRTVSTEKIIKYLLQFKKIQTLCFDEANFIVDKKRVIGILQQMIDHNIHPKYAWPSVSIDSAQNDKLLKLCTEVSQFHFLIGLESINQKVLNSYNKKQTPDIIRKSINKLHDYGIKVHGAFIFGSDYDDKSSFKKTVDFCQSADIDFPTFSALTPYVGTDIRADFEKSNRIFTNNWDFYDGTHVVFYPKNMTPYKLQEGIISAYQNFYSNSKGLNHIKRGELFYGFGTFYVRRLFKKIIRKNQEYLEYLEKVSSKCN